VTGSGIRYSPAPEVADPRSAMHYLPLTVRLSK
jgi:hypothetical protein